MSRLQTVRDNWTEITAKLLRDKQELAKFLQFSAGMYKQSFSDAALIYQQNPNATKVATLETWNKLGRLVNKGEHSIAVFGEGSRAKHLFDITQTNGKRVPKLWKLDDSLSADLTNLINQKYGRSCKNIQETIAAMSVDNIRPHLSEMMYATGQMKLTDEKLKAYQQSVVSAVRFVVSTRSELDSNIKISGGINLNAADMFKDTRDLIRFCDIVQKSAKDTLLEMEREVVNIIKQRREKSHELQTQPDRTAQSRNSVHGQPRRTENASKANWQMGQNVAGVGENRIPDRGTDIRDGGTVEHHSEGNRPRGGETLSRTGQAVQTGKSSSDDISRNSDMGEKQTSDDRTQGNFGGSISDERITVDSLIERYNHADFNRRWDSFEIAGWILNDAKSTEYRIDPIDHFNKFDADKYSETQANEIRNIIKAALENRAIEIPQEKEPVIINNSVVETSKLPPFLDEKLIHGIIKHDDFFKAKREDIAKYFAENEDMEKRTEFMKSVYRMNEYTELDVEDTRVGYKAEDKGLTVWEGNYLSRTKESIFSWDLVQSFTADLIEKGEYLDKKLPDRTAADYAEELEKGDKIKFQGEIWTVKSAGEYAVSLENEQGENKYLSNTPDSKWYEEMNKIGFEFIHEQEIEQPIFAEPIKEKQEIEPLPQGEQLSLFGEPEPLVEPVPKPKKNIAVSNTAPTTDMVDHVLRGGSSEPRSLERIAAQFQKGKSIAENAEFLRKEFGEDGRGYKYYSPERGSAALLASWSDNSGITVAISNTAFPEGKKAHLNWEQTAERIGELLYNGEFCSQDIIDRAQDIETKEIADKLWYLHQDCEVEYFIPDEMFKGGFPDSTERIKNSMADKATLQKYIDGLTDLVKQYEENHDVLCFHFHKPKELLNRLKDLQLERKEFITKSDFTFEPKFFITEDEKDKLLTGGSEVQNGKFRIAEFFKEEHTLPEKIAFLKKEYGDGGSGRTGFNTWHDAKGLKYQKGVSLSNPDCEVFMKWNEVANRIDKLISEDRYITQKDIDERIRHAKYVLKNYSEDNPADKYHIDNAKKILDEYGEKEPQKSPVEKLIEKAQAAGIPVETEEIPTETKEAAVFMDTRDESFIAVMQTEDGIDYTEFAPDLTPVDGGVWQMDEEMDLKYAASSLLAVSENMLAEVSDYDKFMAMADMNTEIDVPKELAKMKSDMLANIPNEKTIPKQEDIQPNVKAEEPKVNAPEKIAVTQNTQKSGIPYTYRFNEKDIAANGAKSRFQANVEAIRTLRKVEAENRYATPEEQAVMAKYVGWGGISQAFVTDRAAESIGNLGNAAPTGWENEQKTLREILTDEEYKAARASTLTSFYTPPDVADGVYQALSKFGFEGGNVLEPSMGVGNFFAKMPENIRDNSRLYGVELDSISGRIAQQLYPNERIQIKGFEQTSFNNNSFDVVVGNVPFGDYKVSDKAYDKHNFKIHDYFAAKAVDKVKPGGVVALVTSKFTMDKQNEKARRYLAERCDLLGAVRLPSGTFKDADSVTTDILFLKKSDIV